MSDNQDTTAARLRQRLHPLSPVLRGIKSVGVVVAAISWQGFARFGVSTGAAVVAAAGVAGLLWAWISWYFTGFDVTGRELRINDGVLFRRHRTIRLERLQSVEVVQPLLARLVGLAELKCEVVGATKTEAPLAYLALPQAKELRARLLSLSRKLDDSVIAEADIPATPTPVAEPARPAPILELDSRRLIISQLLTPQVFFIPIGVAFTIALFVWQPDITFFGLAGLITATAGILLKPVRQAMVDYHFTLGDTEDGLRIRRGLTEQRTQTLPLNRVTGLTIVWPLLWRKPGWTRCQVANAGRGGIDTHDGTSAGTLLPVGTLDEARLVTMRALPGVDILAATPIPAPDRARWVAPIGQPALGAVLTDEVFIARSGRLTRRLVAVPYARIQSVRVVQKRIPRALGLATVHIEVAGGLPGIQAKAEHREVSEALWMADQLRIRARRQLAAEQPQR